MSGLAAHDQTRDGARLTLSGGCSRNKDFRERKGVDGSFES